MGPSPSTVLGSPEASHTAAQAAPKRIRCTGRREAPFLPSSAEGPARLLRTLAVGAPGAAAWLSRSGPWAFEGRRPSERGRGLRSATPLAAWRLQRRFALPRRRLTGLRGNTLWKQIFQGGFWRGGRQSVGNVSPAPDDGTVQDKVATDLHTKPIAGRLAGSECESDRVTVALPGLPAPAPETLLLFQPSRPGLECQEEAPNITGGGKPFSCVPHLKSHLPQLR